MKGKDRISRAYSWEFGSLDILMINDRPYFPATECAVALGYRNPHKAIRDHCKGVNKTFRPTAGGTQKKSYIPEGDLYRLIIRSNLPAAERFEKWVFDEVLPTIRRRGVYAAPDMPGDTLDGPKPAQALIKSLDRERRRADTLEELATEMAPKALYCDLVLKSTDTVLVSLIAKDYGMSAAAFNRVLHNLGVQYRAGGTWVLYQRYADKGYTQTRTWRLGGARTSVHTCWTQAGRLFLYGFLKARAILPLIECARGEQFSIWHTEEGGNEYGR
jgi:prophage antirepressor-like protein